MPDSNTPWTPDEAFWNEGWADMESRLDRKRRKRLLLPLLLLLTLLGAGTLVLWPEGKPDNPPPTPTLAAAAVSGGVANTRLMDEPTSTPVDPQIVTTPGPALPPRISAAAPAAPAPAPAAHNPAATVPLRATDELQAASPRPSDATATGLLPTLSIAPLTFNYNFILNLDSAVLERDVTLEPMRLFNLEVGTSAYSNSFLPGGYVQVRRQFAGPGRWFVPVGFRYDCGRRWVRTTHLDNPRELFSSGVPPASLNTAPPPNEIRQPRDLHTHTLGLRTGLARRITRRLTLGGGLEASYLLGGSGPTYAVSDSSGVVTVTVTEERLSQSGFGSGRNMDLAAGSGGNHSTAVLNPTLNRWAVSAWLAASYRLSGNMHLSLGTSRWLSPVYPEGNVTVERQRLELGLRWGG